MTSDKSVAHIVLSPHLDDAVFSLGGFIATHASVVKVVTFFVGNPTPKLRGWWDRLCGFKDSDQAIQCRLIEDRNAFSKLGVDATQLNYRPYLDIQYREALHANGPQEKKNILANLVNDIGALLNKYKGDRVAIYFPLMHLHPDHKLLSEAAMAVYTNQTENSVVTFYGYEDLPYTYFFNLKNKFLKAFLSKGKRFLVVAGREIEPESVEFPLSILNQKMSAINEYKSQFVGLRHFLLFIVKKMASRGKRKRGTYHEVFYKLGKSSQKIHSI